MHFAFFNFLFFLPLFASAIPLGLVPRDDANPTTLFGIETNTFVLQLLSYTIQELDFVLNLTLSEASSDNNDNDTQTLFEVAAAIESLDSDIQDIIGVFNCSFPIDFYTFNANGSQISSRDGMSYAQHFLSGLAIGGETILKNESLTLNDDTQAIVTRAVDMGRTIGDSVAASRFPGVDVSQTPPMSLEEYAATVTFANGYAVCSNSQGFSPSPSISIAELTTSRPFVMLEVPDNVLNETSLCPSDEPCFCQSITQANGTSTVSVTPATQCQYPETPGPFLQFITNSPTPLSTDASDRAQNHESSILFLQRYLLVPQSLI